VIVLHAADVSDILLGTSLARYTTGFSRPAVRIIERVRLDSSKYHLLH